MAEIKEPPWSIEYVDRLASELEAAADCVWAGPAIDGDLLLIDHLRAYAKVLRRTEGGSNSNTSRSLLAELSKVSSCNASASGLEPGGAI
jgi:hypothetical protein